MWLAIAWDATYIFLKEIEEQIQISKRTFKVEKIRELISLLKEFNSLNLQEIIELTENDQVISISDAVYEEWKFIGLSNQSFVEMEFWKKP